MSKSTKQEGDGYGDMPLNTRQTNAVSIIKQWFPLTQDHTKCVKTSITVISNVMYHPKEEKYQKLRLNKPKVKKVIVDIVGGIKLLKLAGFEQKTEKNGNKILCIESPTTIEEFEQLTDIWLVLLKTQYLWGINPDKNAPKDLPLPKQFVIPNTLKYLMDDFFASNEMAKSNEFQQLVKNSNNPNLSPTALERYTYFGNAIKLLSKSDETFFNLDAKHGLNDIDVSDVAAMIISEILCGYYDEDVSYTNLILAEDLRIMAEQQKEFMQQQYQISSAATTNTATNENQKTLKQESSLDDKKKDDKKDEDKKNEDNGYKKDDKILLKMKDDELIGTIRWIGQSEKWDKGIWYGVELDSENLIYGHNGYFNEERFFGCADNFGIYVKKSQIIKIIGNDADDEKKKNENDTVKNININNDSYKVIDIGCGWGNVGRLLMDKESRPYLTEIEKESKLKKVDIYGFDISKEMLSIGKDNGYNKYYKDMICMDCKREEIKQFNDSSIDIIISCNCIMQDKKIGHPSETFLIEANRLLKQNGWFVVTRRFHGIHLGLQLYAYLMIAQQLGWKNVFASRVREVFFIGWQKMSKPEDQ